MCYAREIVSQQFGPASKRSLPGLDGEPLGRTRVGSSWREQGWRSSLLERALSDCAAELLRLGSDRQAKTPHVELPV